MSDDQLWLLLTAPTNNSKENSSSSSSSFADEVVAELRESLRSAPLEIDSRVKKILRLQLHPIAFIHGAPDQKRMRKGVSKKLNGSSLTSSRNVLKLSVDSRRTDTSFGHNNQCEISKSKK